MFIHTLLPGFVRIMGWIMLLSPDIGIINDFLREIIPVEKGPLSCYNLTFMILLMGISMTPTLFLMFGGAFMAIDPSLEESAEASGMNRRQVFMRITLPLLKPAILAGAIYVFVTAASVYEVPALLGAPAQVQTFATLMFDNLMPARGLPQLGVVAVYGIIMLIPTLVTLYYYQRLMKLSHRYTTVTGKGYRPKLTALGGWKWAGDVSLGMLTTWLLTQLSPSSVSPG